MKAVMYHYVRRADPARPHFRFLHLDDFRRQLDWFGQAFGFVTRAEWEACLAARDPAPGEGKVVLTFDDAMSCHYDHVFPELRARGLWGMFYVPALPYLTGRMLDVHRVHLLCGAVEGKRLFQAASDAVTEEMVPFEKRGAFRTDTYRTQENAPGVSAFKRLCNYYCAEPYRQGLIDGLMEQFGVADPGREFYVTEAQLLEMHEGGMVMGSHTVSHPVMSKLDRAAQGREIGESFAFLRKLGVDGGTYCHPYGGFHSFDADTVDLLEGEGVAWSFNVESRDISARDLAKARQALPRYDCNEFPHGVAS